MQQKGSFSTFLLIVIFIAGLSLLLYPHFANYWNSMHASLAISNYSDAVKNMGKEEYERMWQEAVDYNDTLLDKINGFILDDDQHAAYENVLNVGDSGVMGYIEIPAIDVYLPIYHGTSEGVLQIAVGHLDWTSLPVGGDGTHCVLSGHRGLPSAKLFTDLDKVVEGDVFMIRVLNKVLTYEIDHILIVDPTDVSALQIVDGKDYCTLVTCTPYGINTHRLLVRGHRIDNAEQAASVHVTAEAIQVEPTLVAFVIGVPTLILLLVFAFLIGQNKNDHNNDV